MYTFHKEGVVYLQMLLKGRTTDRGIKTKSSTLRSGYSKTNFALFLMILPAVALVFVFAYIPMPGIVIAFKSLVINKGIWGSPWVGFSNFSFFFTSGKAWLLTRNTILYNLSFLLVNTVLEIISAIVISEMIGKLYKRVVQSVMILPYFLSWVIVGGFVYNIFGYEHGLLNTVMRGLNQQPINVYADTGAWKFILVGVSAWKSVGYFTIIYLSSIMGINTDMYEAAYIDGANIYQRIWYITLPGILPTAVILILLSVGGLLRGNFDMFYQIIRNTGFLYNATDVIDTYVFRSLINSQNWGMASAATFYQQFIGFMIVIVANYMVKRVEPDYALF